MRLITPFAAIASVLLVGCASTQEEIDATVVGEWIIETSTDSETQRELLFATLFPEPGFDDEILWLGLICDDAELEVGFGLAQAYDPASPLVITTQIGSGPVADRQGDFFGDGAVIGFASNDVALAFLDEIAGGTALTVTADSDGAVQGPALFDVTGAAAVAQQIGRDCL